MFNYTYTDFNNEPERLIKKTTGEVEDLRADPLGLRRCMRFFPHDDNQGGFFVAVFEKIHDEEDGLLQDRGYSKDAWANPKVRQRQIGDELADFVSDVEKMFGDKVDKSKLAEMKGMLNDEDEEETKEEKKTSE